mgnify:CR=1 FL=1
MDDAASQLEVAMADLGRLLLRLQKYRGTTTVHAACLADALLLGDRARAGHRRQTLGSAAAGALLAEAHRLRERLAAAIARVHDSSLYRTAVRAHAQADFGTLRCVLPELFAELEPIADPRPCFTSVPWLRRGRPRAPADIVASIVRLAAEGLPAEGSPEAPGTDPELPAVPLAVAPPAEEPLVLTFAPQDVPPALFQLAASGSLLVHVARLHAPFQLHVAEEVDVEAGVDWPSYRASLVASLAAAGFPDGG